MTARRPLLSLPLLSLAGAALPVAARAQPVAEGRPLRLIVPFPPGGAIDILGRLLAERLGAALGQTVVVENRAGAGGVIGVDALAKAPPDGSTIGVLGLTTWTAMPSMFSSLPFEPARDLQPLSLVTAGALLCVVNAETARRRGWTDFRALVEWARAHPEQVTMGSSGTGTSSHLCISAVNQATGARILHVPYRGGGPAIQDLLSGTIDMMFDVMPALMPHVRSGAFKALAVSSARRAGGLPEVPGMADFADLGLDQVDIVTWNAVAGPAGMPAEAVARLAAALRAIVAQPGFAERLTPLGYDPVSSESPEALAALIARETPVWARLVEISGARLD